MKTGIILFGILVAMNNVNAQTDEFNGKDYGEFIKSADTIKRDYDRISSQSRENAREIRVLDAELRGILRQINNFDL